jgi:hypothetical protein
VLHEWRHHWEADPAWRPWNGQVHGAHHRIFTDADEAELAQVIVTEYIGKGRQFIGPTFRRLPDEVYAQTGRDDSSFQCSDPFIADFKGRHGFSCRRFHMRRRNRHCGRRDIECWTEQTTMLLAKGRMGTEEGQ